MTNESLNDIGALEKAVYWFLCERSAQMGESYTLHDHEAAIAEDQDYISDIRFQVKSAIKAYLGNLPSNPTDVKIGKYSLQRHSKYIWISAEDGEGGGFDEEKLEKAIGEFYAKHF